MGDDYPRRKVSSKVRPKPAQAVPCEPDPPSREEEVVIMQTRMVEINSILSTGDELRVMEDALAAIADWDESGSYWFVYTDSLGDKIKVTVEIKTEVVQEEK